MSNMAMRREKRLKEWQRQWKIDLIEKNNPNWIDLYSKYNGLILWIPRSSRGMTDIQAKDFKQALRSKELLLKKLILQVKA